MSLRVAMVVDRFPHEPFLAQQVAELLRSGIDVHILCQISDPASPSWELLDGVDLGGRIHPWPDRDQPVARVGAAARAVVGAGLGSGSKVVSAALAARAEPTQDGGRVGSFLFAARVAAIAPDVLHFQFADLARRRVPAAGAIEAAFTSSFRGYDLSYAGLDIPDFYRSLWPVLDGAHTLGRDLRALAEARGCPDDLPWTLIPPAVDLSRFQPVDRSTGRGEETRLLSIGRLHWKKAYPDALAAVAELRGEGRSVRYRIVGTGPAEDHVRWAVRDLGLDDHVELIGQVGPDEICAQLQWADVFLHAALTEGFGNSVLEAQAMALPVVCTDAEGLAENVENGVTGVVVPRRRPDRSAAALAAMIDDRDRANAMGAAGRRRVEQHFALGPQTEAFVDFFHRAAARATDRRR